MAWLIYLALSDSRFHDQVQVDDKLLFDRKVLSRPQFLVSNLVVVAQVDRVDGPSHEVTIKEVLGPKDESKWIGRKIPIANLAACADSWARPGFYILPLMTDRESTFRIAPIPPSPGAPPPDKREGQPRIYLDTPETRQQLADIYRARRTG
jgi:hypothetical protein